MFIATQTPLSIVDARESSHNWLDLSIVVPTYNERENISEIVRRLTIVLAGLRWELIFVDDDSPDGTPDIIESYARSDKRIRLIHRLGRRGLSSACIEGIMSTSAPYTAVMDADAQHDENILPAMLHQLRVRSLDVVVGTRNAKGGSMGDFSRRRILLSRIGSWISTTICHCGLTDPMSGYFLVDRSFFLEVAPQLQVSGFKILLDIFSSSKRPPRFAEVGYSFRQRMHGSSKLDTKTATEFLFLVISKATHDVIPPRFVVFSLVGAAGLLTHLACLLVLFGRLHISFTVAQSAAAVLAMTENFFLNNMITYRDRSLRGKRLFAGLLTFWLACSFGAWANVAVAKSLLTSGVSWYIAGSAGIIVGSVWNYSMSSLFTWQMPKNKRKGN